METLAIISTALSLLLMFFKEFLSETARRRQLEKDFKLDQENFFKIAQSSIDSMRERAKKEQAQAQDVEDQIDSYRNRK